MKSVFVSLGFFLFCVGSFGAAVTEQTYLAARDGYRKQFKKDTVEAVSAEKPALQKLDKMLHEIIGPVEWTGFNKGKISIDTLVDHEEMQCYNNLDGLNFLPTPANAKEQIFVTTKTLVSEFKVKDKKWPKDLNELFKSNIFYDQVFGCSGSARDVYAEIPLDKTKAPFEMAKAFLVLAGQDIGPFPPSEIEIVATKGSKIIVYESDLPEGTIDQITECKSQWEKFNQKPPTATAGKEDDSWARGGKAFATYKSCFAKNLKAQTFYPKVIDQAQKQFNKLHATALSR